MAIFARDLSVRSYRNFERYDLALDEGVTVLVGRNAQGKTNLVEALQLLTAGQSFRKPSPAELVQTGEEGCSLSLRLEGDGRVLDHELVVASARRSFRRNGKKCAASGVRGALPSVLFCPDDLDMVKRSASVRRSALDSFGMQMSERYAQLVSAYERTVEQRNNLLKERFCTRDLLAAWNESIASTGASLLVHRLALLARIRAHFVRAYASIAPHEVADMAYQPSIGDLEHAGAATSADDAARAKLRHEAQERFLACLEERADEELRRGLTLSGPHRDEILLTVDGRDARHFASQGQQRSLVLAWKVAEVEVTRDILGRPPLLLLDDVMSELDAHRREAFLGFIAGEVQTVITTTNLGYFSDEILSRAKVVRVGDGDDGVEGGVARET